MLLIGTLGMIGCRPESGSVQPDGQLTQSDDQLAKTPDANSRALPGTASPDSPPPAEPKSAIELQQEGLAALKAGDLKAAMDLARAAVASAPDDPQSTFLLARVLGERKRYPEAIRLLDKMSVEIPSTRLPVLGQTAEWMVLQGDWEEAETRYRTLLEAAPKAAIVHRMLARLLNRQGRRLEAATHFRRLCQEGDIEESDLRFLLSVSFPLPDDATTEELLPIGPLGDARYEVSLGNTAAAIEDLDEQAIASDPACDALLGRVLASSENGDALDAWAARQHDESVRESADYWFAVGVSAARSDQHELAVKRFCETVLRDRTDQQAYIKLSESLAKIEDPAKSAEAKRIADLLQQTQTIGNEMAATGQRNLKNMSQLIRALDELHRPFEALAWRAVQVAYGRSEMPAGEAQQVLAAINQDRVKRLAESRTDDRSFILCGVELDSLNGESDDSETKAENGR